MRERVLRVSIKVSSRLCLTSCFLSSLQLWTDEVVNPHCVRSVLICAGLENYRMKANKQTVNRWKYKQRKTEKYSRDIAQLTAEIEWNWNPPYLHSRFGFAMQRPTSCESGNFLLTFYSEHFPPSHVWQWVCCCCCRWQHEELRVEYDSSLGRRASTHNECATNL